jgi:hypothetical protein
VEQLLVLTLVVTQDPMEEMARTVIMMEKVDKMEAHQSREETEESPI